MPVNRLSINIVIIITLAIVVAFIAFSVYADAPASGNKSGRVYSGRLLEKAGDQGMLHADWLVYKLPMG